MKIIPTNPIISERIPLETYKSILDNLPLACVDVVAYRGNPGNRSILMVERKEKPAQGLLWFPGGRLYKNESLEDAARRKLREECSLTEIVVEKQIGAFPFSSRDTIFPDIKHGFHAIGIDYLVRVLEKDPKIQLDSTSGKYAWVSQIELSKKALHPYVAEVLNASNVFNRQFENIDRKYEV